MKKQNKIAVILIVLVCCGLLLIGCSKDKETKKAEPTPTPKPVPTIIKAQIQVLCDVNPGLSGKPSPIVVHLYDLSAKGAFVQADYFSLAKKGKAVLGDDLVAKEMFHLKPGEKKLIQRTLASKTRYLAVVAAYRDIDQALWRGVIAIPAHQTSYIIIKVGKLAVSVKMDKAVEKWPVDIKDKADKTDKKAAEKAEEKK